MAKRKYPVTPAVRLLRDQNVEFEAYLYEYQDSGGAPLAAKALDVPGHRVVKTLVMQTDEGRPMLVLMHGDREVSTKKLARELGVKRVDPCTGDLARRYTGYEVGGISPFGTRHQMPVYAEASILALDKIYINGGKRGFMIEIDPKDLGVALAVTPVNVAI